MHESGCVAVLESKGSKEHVKVHGKIIKKGVLSSGRIHQVTNMSPLAPVYEDKFDIFEVSSMAHVESDNAAYSAATSKILSHDCKLVVLAEWVSRTGVLRMIYSTLPNQQEAATSYADCRRRTGELTLEMRMSIAYFREGQPIVTGPA
ncbi:hypothetical protein AgCh_007853 [Apium graveolens]